MRFGFEGYDVYKGKTYYERCVIGKELIEAFAKVRLFYKNKKITHENLLNEINVIEEELETNNIDIEDYVEEYDEIQDLKEEIKQFVIRK